MQQINHITSRNTFAGYFIVFIALPLETILTFYQRVAVNTTASGK